MNDVSGPEQLAAQRAMYDFASKIDRIALEENFIPRYGVDIQAFFFERYYLLEVRVPAQLWEDLDEDQKEKLLTDWYLLVEDKVVARLPKDWSIPYGVEVVDASDDPFPKILACKLGMRASFIHLLRSFFD